MTHSAGAPWPQRPDTGSRGRDAHDAAPTVPIQDSTPTVPDQDLTPTAPNLDSARTVPTRPVPAPRAGTPTGTGPASPGAPSSPGTPDPLDDTVVALTSGDLAPAQRRQLMRRLAGEVRARGVKDLFRPKTAVRWISDTVSEIAPRIPIRSLDQLRGQHPGMSDEAIAERLVRDAARLTAAVGAAGGGLAAIEWVATPTLLTAPVLLATETIVVVAIELKLIGELHELHGHPIEGRGAQRAVSLVHAWSRRRGVNPLAPGMAMTTALGTAARKELRDRLLRRFGRNLTSLGPFLTGAAVAAVLNRRATHSLAREVRRDLRQRQRPAIGPGTASGT